MLKRIGIIGAGTIGLSIAADLLLNNKKVVLVEESYKIRENVKKEIANILRFSSLQTGKTISKKIIDIDKQVTVSHELNCLSECDFIIENITENIHKKTELYIQLDKIVDGKVPIGANTSCISITLLGSFIRNPSMLIGLHLMNPVYLKKIAEVILGHYTSDECVHKTKEFLKSIDKDAIIVQDFPGFVSNRISHLYINEAAFVVQEHISNPREVDLLFEKGFGHAMGPLKTADLIGLDTVVNSLQILYESYQDTKFRCCPLLKKMVFAGKLGVKSKEGFYKY